MPKPWFEQVPLDLERIETKEALELLLEILTSPDDVLRVARRAGLAIEGWPDATSTQDALLLMLREAQKEKRLGRVFDQLRVPRDRESLHRRIKEIRPPLKRIEAVSRHSSGKGGPRVFINYRRADGALLADYIYGALAERMSPENIFIDVDSIPSGIDFSSHIDGWISKCDVLLVIMGHNWLSIADDSGQSPRLDDKDDFVRAEIRTALRRQIRVIPVLFEDVDMPPQSALPEDIRALTRMNGVSVNRRSQAEDVERLLDEAGVPRPNHLPRRVFMASLATGALGIGAWQYASYVQRPRLIVGRPERDAYGWITRVGIRSEADLSSYTYFNLRFVEAGSFMMGSTPDDPERDAKNNEEEPQHRVELSRGFWLGETACTQDSYEAVMGSNPSHFKGGSLPVDSVAYAACLDLTSELTGQRAGLSFSLPTEAQWEYACRATTQTPRYGPLEEVAWYQRNSEGRVHPVGKKAPNPWGFYDMLGNVFEWCRDGKRRYGSSCVDPVGPRTSSTVVVRGGSWRNSSRWARASSRLSQPRMDVADNRLGVRLLSENSLEEMDAIAKKS